MEDVVACMRQHRRSAAARGKRQGRDRVEKVLDLDREMLCLPLFFSSETHYAWWVPARDGWGERMHLDRLIGVFGRLRFNFPSKFAPL
jgi:hypothetical protein